MRLRLSRPAPGRPARLPDALQSVALFLLFVGFISQAPVVAYGVLPLGDIRP
jgi:hypothetical protein